MLKTLLIGLKDLRLIFRDRAALLMMLAAPFALTLGLGLVTGRFSGRASGIEDIPVVVVNQDGGQLGNALEEVFASPELAGLLDPQNAVDAASARRLVNEDHAAAAVIIPRGFTGSIIPAEGQYTDPATLNTAPVQIEIYANPVRSVGADIVETIVDEFLSRVEEGRTTGMTSILQLLNSGRITPQQAEEIGRAMAEQTQAGEDASLAIRMDVAASGEQAGDFDVLAYIAPGFALMFLMYTVSYGGRSILAEKTQGTLPRLMVSPTTSGQILAGKVFGIFLTGTAQLGILILASFLFFGLKWGHPLAVAVLVLAAVFGASGWGMLITALARSPGQVASLGSAIMLIFGILGGTFISLDQMPAFVQALSRITPNAWALDAFTTLGLKGTLEDILGPILALVVMGAVLSGISSVLFRRNLVQP